MPTPRRTSLEAIVAAGRDLLEVGGLDGLTMQSVADRVGVRAPSLYKRVRNRSDLVALVADASIRDLGERLDAAAAAAGGDAREALRRLAAVARAFAHERPAAFALVFAPGADLRLEDDSLAAASASVLRVASELAGPEHALDAARTFTAWANGFISMELAGAFRLAGEVDRAFDFGIDRLSRAMSLPST
ncbi:TetR/AcrR family transcriptional regulator [Agromyces sp. Marseille-P2726]|uniref:TetR/AcrR family transcriptional regulator n=1 Tax=Agromyces sp. Marseille-P2726 TaxID=2709132 RepID=UPI00156D9656|nr:TetR/AcrR family transcriptional regulator [Agromyces sp. Marseille-P2726]